MGKVSGEPSRPLSLVAGLKWPVPCSQESVDPRLWGRVLPSPAPAPMERPFLPSIARGTWQGCLDYLAEEPAERTLRELSSLGWLVRTAVPNVYAGDK